VFVGTVAKRVGLSSKTVRYYSDLGLVEPARDQFTGYRFYTEDDVAKLKFVKNARRFDFSISECKALLSLNERHDRASFEVKAIATRKLNELNKTLDDLNSIRDNLISLASSCPGNEDPSCPILDAFAND
jgi:MerR family copper efflux transcriptional regulator